MGEPTFQVLRGLYSAATDMLVDGTLTQRPDLNPVTVAVLCMPNHLGFVDAIKSSTSSMMRQPKVGMKTVAMLAICTDGYAINHRTVAGVTREAMSKLWDLIESKSLSFMDAQHSRMIMMGRSSTHYLQLFSNMPTPISMRTSRNDPQRTDARNESMKLHYDGTLASALPHIDWENSSWDFVSGPEVYACIEFMDSDAATMVQQATGVEQELWELPAGDAGTVD